MMAGAPVRAAERTGAGPHQPRHALPVQRGEGARPFGIGCAPRRQQCDRATGTLPGSVSMKRVASLPNHEACRRLLSTTITSEPRRHTGLLRTYSDDGAQYVLILHGWIVIGAGAVAAVWGCERPKFLRHAFETGIDEGTKPFGRVKPAAFRDFSRKEAPPSRPAAPPRLPVLPSRSRPSRAARVRVCLECQLARLSSR